jgi:hypothetical protein
MKEGRNKVRRGRYLYTEAHARAERYPNIRSRRTHVLLAWRSEIIRLIRNVTFSLISYCPDEI